MFVDLACNIYTLDYTAYQQLVPTINMTIQCMPKFVARLEVEPGTTCTGLSSGLRSNVSVPVTFFFWCCVFTADAARQLKIDGKAFHHTHNMYAVHPSSALAMACRPCHPCAPCSPSVGLHGWQPNGGALAASPLTDILLSTQHLSITSCMC